LVALFVRGGRRGWFDGLGVGPSTRRRLEELGVSSLEQIAAATSIAVFRLGGEDAEMAARAIGAPTEAIRSLAVGEWLGRVAYSPTRHPPT